MVSLPKISVIITTHKRYKTIPQVIKGWLETGVNEVILIDNGNLIHNCSNGFTLMELEEDYHINSNFLAEMFDVGQDPRFSLITPTNPSYKTRVDYAIGNLTNGDFIIYADDDVVPKKGFVQDLYIGWQETKGMVGIIGRTFHGPRYKGDTKYYRSDKLCMPKRTGFVGVVYMCERKYSIFDTRGIYCPNIDELYHEMEMFPEVPCYVVPTDRYEDLPEASDKTAMFHNKDLTKIRHEYYAKMYAKNLHIYSELWDQQ